MAELTALSSAESRRSTTTLGSPLSTTLTRHLWSTPPFGPLTSDRRTVTRSIEDTNFPSLIPSFRAISSRSSLSTVAPSTRMCPGGCISGVRPRTCLAARGIDEGSADRCAVVRRGRRLRLGPVAERGAFLPLVSPLPGGRRSGGRSVRTVGRVAPRPKVGRAGQ